MTVQILRRNRPWNASTTRDIPRPVLGLAPSIQFVTDSGKNLVARRQRVFRCSRRTLRLLVPRLGTWSRACGNVVIMPLPGP